jgi:hypothetical protein
MSENLTINKIYTKFFFIKNLLEIWKLIFSLNEKGIKIFIILYLERYSLS